MKFMFSADWHLSIYSSDKLHPESKLPERLHHIKNSIIYMCEYAVRNFITKFVVGGDVMHTKSIIHADAQSILLDIVREYSMIDFIIIDGNHDVSSRSGTGISALKSLDNEPNVTMIHTTKKIDNILYVPFYKDQITDISLGNRSGVDILVSHFGLNEGMLNSGISIKSEVGVNDLQQYKLVLLGHYHQPQQIKHVYYVGSPCQLNWGEKGDEKRFLIVDSDNLDVQSVLIEGYKKHIELEISSTESKIQIIEQANQLISEGHAVKIIVKESIDLDGLQSFNTIDQTEKDIMNRGIDSTMTLDEKMIEFLEISEIPKDKWELYMSVGKRIVGGEIDG